MTSLKNYVFSVLEKFQAKKKILAICLGVYTVGCVHSLKIKIFRYVAMNRHIQSLHFTTKIRKIRSIWSCFSNYGDNTVVSQLHNLLCYHPSSQPRLFPFFCLVHVPLEIYWMFLRLHICVESMCWEFQMIVPISVNNEKLIGDFLKLRI